MKGGSANKANKAIVFDEEEYDPNKVIITPVTPIPQINIHAANGVRFEIDLGNVESGAKRKRRQSNVGDNLLQPQLIQVQQQKRIKSLQAQNQPQPGQNAYSFADKSMSNGSGVNQSIKSQQKQVYSNEKAQKQISVASRSQVKSKNGRKGSFTVISEKKSSVSVRKVTEHFHVVREATALEGKREEGVIDNKSINVLKNNNLQEVSESMESDVGDNKGLARRRRAKNIQKDNSLQRGQDSSMIVLDKQPGQLDQNQNQINLKQLREIALAMTCPPPHRLWKCNVIIDRSCCSYPIFSLRKKDQTFLVNAQKQFFHMHSYYQISAHEKIFGSSERSHLGSLRSNFTGTEFNLYEQKKGVLELACTICYKAEISCFATFRNIQVYIRDPQLSYSQLHGAGDDSLNLKELYQYEQNVESKKIVRLVNKKPEWNEKHQVYIMNMKGRSKMASVKNMALIDEQNPQKYVMLFCKTEIDNFHLEIVWPLSPFIALGILLSSFDFKLCCQ